MSNGIRKSTVTMTFAEALASREIEAASSADAFSAVTRSYNTRDALRRAYGHDEVELTGANRPADDIHITLAVGHCGKADCTRCDPMERMVEGLSVHECLAVFTKLQQDGGTHHQKYVPAYLGGTHLTPLQKDAARMAWSSELKRKQVDAREQEKVVVVDDDRWEP